MIEILKHTFGFCGDHWHPNIWTILLGGVGILPAGSYLRVYIKSKLKR
jgi:hypothetical protein